jgi:hypothetical protein
MISEVSWGHTFEHFSHRALTLPRSRALGSCGNLGSGPQCLTLSLHYPLTHLGAAHGHQGNVRGEPVFSVMAAGWFCEKSGCIGKVEDVKPVL